MSEVYQSKWGFHSTSREVSKKLRYLNEVYSKALHGFGSWKRWERKAPHNRVQKRAIRDEAGNKIGTEILLDSDGQPIKWNEPEVCPIFFEKSIFIDRSFGIPIFGPVSFPIRITDNGLGEKIREAARQARKPQLTQEEVKPLKLSDEEIQNLYQMFSKPNIWFVGALKR